MYLHFQRVLPASCPHPVFPSALAVSVDSPSPWRACFLSIALAILWTSVLAVFETSAKELRRNKPRLSCQHSTRHPLVFVSYLSLYVLGLISPLLVGSNEAAAALPIGAQCLLNDTNPATMCSPDAVCVPMSTVQGYCQLASQLDRCAEPHVMDSHTRQLIVIVGIFLIPASQHALTGHAGVLPSVEKGISKRLLRG